jgi:hypothetical protein
LNWSKGLTVKEKILIHLSDLAPYSNYDEVPNTATQQGIAELIMAPRPHVSIALKDLRSKDLLAERTSRVTSGKRRQKVYFLSGSGLQFAKSLKDRLKANKIRVVDGSGAHHLEIAQVCSKYQISLLKLVNNITDDGTLNLLKTTPERLKTPKVIKHVEKTMKKPEPLPPHGVSTELPSVTPSQPDFTPVYKHLPKPVTSGSGAQDDDYFINMYYTNPEYFKKHYSELYGYERPLQSEKLNAILLIFGYIFMLMGTLCGLYLLTTSETLLLIPMVLLITFSITMLLTSSVELWVFPHWRKRILNLFTVTIPIILYIIFFVATDPSASFYDLGLWLIILFSFLGLASFGTFIPQSQRAQVLAILGIVILINAILSLLLATLSIYQAGFWILSGVLCEFVGYTLATEEIENVYSGLILGSGLGILIACGYVALELNQRTGFEFTADIILSLILWAIVACFLMLQSFRTPPDAAQPVTIKINQSLYASIPLFIGVILIFFGLFLIRYGKVLETLVEVFLGVITLIYGLQRLKGQDKSSLVLIFLILLAMVVTLASLFIL